MTGTPSSSKLISVAHTGTLRTKFLVPSMGGRPPTVCLEDCVAAEFLAEYGIRRTMLTERRAHCSLDSQIGVGDGGGEVRLVVHSKVEGAEAGASDRVSLVGDTEGECEVGCAIGHGYTTYRLNRGGGPRSAFRLRRRRRIRVGRSSR